MINILKKKKNLIVGLNSGTSADGLDMAALLIDRSRKSYKVKFIDGKEKKYPGKLKNAILEISDSNTPHIDDVIYLDNALGVFYSKAVKNFILSLHRKNITVDAIASHGQTVRHLPKKITKFGNVVNGTLQIGSADYIAQQTKLPVVSNFRQADIALGGEGAPITTSAMLKLFANSQDNTLIVNIGGMSNYFFLPKKSKTVKTLAEDCGPGNVLSDLLMKKLFNKEYDRNGSIAQSGTISKRLLAVLTAKSFSTVQEKSTGRESFGVQTVESILKYSNQINLSNADILATTMEFTAFSVFNSINSLIKNKKIKKLYLTGGGRKNIFLVKRLQSYLPSCHIENIDRFGIDGDFVEAAAYAVMGEATLQGESLQLIYSNKIKPVYGKITLPPVGG